MSVQININEAQANLIKEYYKQRLAEIKAEIDKLTGEVTEIDKLMNQLNKEVPSKENSANISSNITDGYQVRWPWVKKAAFLITESGRQLSTKDMVALILEKYEPNLIDNRKTVVASLSAVMSIKTKEGLFVRHQNEFGEFEYGLSESKKPTDEQAALNI